MPYVMMIEQDGQTVLHQLKPGGIAGDVIPVNTDDMLMTCGGAIKAIDGAPGRVGGYLVYWGSEGEADLQGEYFTPQTDLGIDWYPQRPALYHHGLDGTLKSTVVGVIDTLKADETGLWAEAQLDLRNRYVAAIQDLIGRGVLHWSSGSLPHLVERVKGWISRWPIVEGSFTPTPADWRQTTRIVPLKSLLANALPLELPPEELPGASTNAPAAKEADILTTSDGDTVSNQPSNNGATPMDIRQMALSILNTMLQARPDVVMTDDEKTALVEQAVSGMGMEATAAVPAEQMEAVASKAANAVKTHLLALIQERSDYTNAAQKAIASAAQTAMRNTPPTQHPANFTGQPQAQPPGAPQIRQMKDRRFDHLKASDMALGAVMLQKLGKPIGEDYLFAMNYKTAQLVEGGDPAANDLAVKSVFPFLKANEVMGVSQSGFGAEYAVTYYSSDVWEAVRQETKVYDRLAALGMDVGEVPDGYKSDTIPLEGADMTWYNAAGATDELGSSTEVTPGYSSSKMATANKEVTLARLSTRSYWQQELDQDSIVNIVAEGNRKVRISGREQLENAIINGDTDVTANTNINLIDGTPAAAPNKPVYTVWNGLAKLPLVTNTANTYNAGATLGEAVYLNLMPLLGDDGKHAADPEKVMFIIDNATYFASLNLAVLKTQDVFPSATIVEGVLRKVWGVEVLRSPMFGKANATGKVSATPGNNTLGRILLVRPDQWAFRWKRQLEIFTEFDPKSYVTWFTAHMRAGFANRDNEASAIARNVSVAIA